MRKKERNVTQPSELSSVDASFKALYGLGGGGTLSTLEELALVKAGGGVTSISVCPDADRAETAVSRAREQAGEGSMTPI